MKMKWRPWTRTASDKIPEFESWDETDSWYRTIVRTGLFAKRTGWLSLLGWSWHVAYHPEEEDDPIGTKDGWAFTKWGAQRAATAAVQDLEVLTL